MCGSKINPPIVVGVDGSRAAAGAVRWAAAEAAAHHTPLHLVSAIGQPIDYGPGLGFAPIIDDAFREASAETLTTAEKSAAEAATLVDDAVISTFVVEAPPIPVLVNRSKEARLLVVGTTGKGAFRRGLLGSVSTALARHAQCPVVAVPATDNRMPDRLSGGVVVGVDGSPCSMAAIAIAFDEASHRGVELVAVHTWSEFNRYLSRTELQEQAAGVLAESLAGFAEQYPDVIVRRVVVEDHPARRLLAESEHAQLIVVGSHGRGGFAGMTLGSVGQAVLHGADIPIIIARQED
ncbi:universal stress protein [Nocardia sp. NBC_00403]|uniref:universal stress protein n=1 Tax=Nocardia sp. NBC_00403 TaxID=2975990 RepID=UPI002E1FC2FB